MIHIEARENLILKACRETSAKIYIYGAGGMGRIVAERLLSDRIPVSGFLVDSQYWKKGETYKDTPVYCIDDVVIDRSITIIPALMRLDRLDKNKIESLKKKTTVLEGDLYCFYFGIVDYAFWKEREVELNKLYYDLADDKSRKHLEAWLNQRISGDLRYLENIWENNTFYSSEIVDFSKIKSFVDCGAYDGDTYLSFLENYRQQMGEEYSGKAYLFEPVNYDQCLLNCGTDKRCKVFRVGVWNKKDKLAFSEQGTASSVIDKDGISVDVDSIDDILNGGVVDFIKMDVEGSERNALKGAEKTLRTYKPILAICVYHRRDDLLTIPQYIRSINSHYKMYLRAHSKRIDDLVLYAIP